MKNFSRIPFILLMLMVVQNLMGTTLELEFDDAIMSPRSGVDSRGAALRYTGNPAPFKSLQFTIRWQDTDLLKEVIGSASAELSPLLRNKYAMSYKFVNDRSSFDTLTVLIWANGSSVIRDFEIKEDDILAFVKFYTCDEDIRVIDGGDMKEFNFTGDVRFTRETTEIGTISSPQKIRFDPAHHYFDFSKPNSLDPAHWVIVNPNWPGLNKWITTRPKDCSSGTLVQSEPAMIEIGKRVNTLHEFEEDVFSIERIEDGAKVRSLKRYIKPSTKPGEPDNSAMFSNSVRIDYHNTTNSDFYMIKGASSDFNRTSGSNRIVVFSKVRYRPTGALDIGPKNEIPAMRVNLNRYPWSLSSLSLYQETHKEEPYVVAEKNAEGVLYHCAELDERDYQHGLFSAIDLIDYSSPNLKSDMSVALLDKSIYSVHVDELGTASSVVEFVGTSLTSNATPVNMYTDIITNCDKFHPYINPLGASALYPISLGVESVISSDALAICPLTPYNRFGYAYPTEFLASYGGWNLRMLEDTQVNVLDVDRLYSLEVNLAAHGGPSNALDPNRALGRIQLWISKPFASQLPPVPPSTTPNRDFQYDFSTYMEIVSPIDHRNIPDPDKFVLTSQPKMVRLFFLLPRQYKDVVGLDVNLEIRAYPPVGIGESHYEPAGFKVSSAKLVSYEIPEYLREKLFPE